MESSVQKWCLSIDDKPHCRRSVTSRTDGNLKKILGFGLADRRQSIEQLPEISRVSWSSVQQILTDDFRIAAKFVNQVLTDNQKECREETCYNLNE